MLFLVTPYSVAVYFIVGMQSNVSTESTLEKYPYMLALMLLLGAIVESLNTIIGFTFLRSPSKAIYVCIGIHCFFLVFSGGIFRWCNIDFYVKLLSYLSPTKYALEGLLINN